MLLSCCEITTYRIFEGLIAPAKLADKNSSELVSVMKDHQNRKRNPIAERFIFNSRNRKLKENISNYMTELRRLSQYLQVWRFPGKKMLRDRLVCGVNHEGTQQRLLSEDVLLIL